MKNHDGFISGVGSFSRRFLRENVDKRDDNQNGRSYVLGTLFREYLGGTQKRRMRLDEREERNFKILKWNNGGNHILRETFIVYSVHHQVIAFPLSMELILFKKKKIFEETRD